LNKCVAIGECGLDYDRLHFAPKHIQLKHFERHFQLTEQFNLPLFLHDRNTGQEFLEIIKKNRHRFTGGVVHSFTGSIELMKQYLDLGLFIGINGCSMKTEENCAAVLELPLASLMLETDSPYCQIKSTHYSYKFIKTKFRTIVPEKYNNNTKTLIKMRNEPCSLIQILEAVAGIKGISIEQLAKAAHENTNKLFFHKMQSINNNNSDNNTITQTQTTETT
jgi:TatD DNase family protein